MKSSINNGIFYFRNSEKIKRPNKISLGVGQSSIHLMRSYKDLRGEITVGEVPKELPFVPKRYFLIHDVPEDIKRGEHAHKICKQFMICVKGSCKVLLDSGENSLIVNLDSPDLGIFIPEMIWGCQYEYSENATLLVFASHLYDKEEYIRNYSDFQTYKRNGI